MKIKLLLTLLFAGACNVVLSIPIFSDVRDTVRLSMCIAKAKSFEETSVFDSAIYYYCAASDIFLQSGDTTGALKCDYSAMRQIGAWKADASALNFLHNRGKKYETWLTGHPLEEAVYYYEIGEKYTDNMEYDSAVVSYKRSFPLWLKNGIDSVKQIKDVYKAISYVYSGTGQYDSAILYLNKALAVYSPKYGLQNRVAENIYLSLGNAYFSKGEINKGLELFHKALKTNLSIPDFFESDLAWTYNSLGISYYVKNDYPLALVYIRKALELFTKIYSEQSMEVAWCNNNMGICYQEMKDEEQAYFYQDKALKIRLVVVGENHPDVASSYNNLGVICENKKDYLKELDFFRKTLRIRKSIFNEINQDIALTYSNIGSTFMLLQQHDSASWYYDKALSIFLNHFKESIGYISKIYVHQSQINLFQGNYTLAFENIRKSLAILVPSFTSTNPADNPGIDDIDFYPDIIRSLENKANALQIYYESMSKDPEDLVKCLSVYRLISDLSDRFSHQLREEGSKLFAEGDAREIFADAVKVSYRLSVIKNDKAYDEQAFYFAEKARAGVLSEAMEESNIRQFAGIPDSLLAEEKKLRSDKINCDLELQELSQSENVSDSSRIKALENKFFSLTSRYQQMIDSFEIKYPVYQYLRNIPREMTSNDIMNGLDSKTALIEYLIAGDSLFIFAFNHREFSIKTVLVDAVVKQQFYDYPRDIRKLKTGTFVSASSLLYSKLILPVKDISMGCERLIIVPDGQLFYIPFETLVSGESKNVLNFSDLDYLIKYFDVSYHYSANLWLRIRNLRPGKAGTLNGFIGFAPVFKSNSREGNIIAANLVVNDSLKGETTLRSATSGGRKFNELIYTEKEISTIAELFIRNKLPARSYLFADATEENFKNQAGKYRYVHIASHGFCDDKEPNLSGIAFYQTKQDFTGLKDLPDEINEKNEGILFSGETYNLILNADLVVLSACESGAGTLMKGEGLMGLSRGFLFAGSPNIIYSLWKIGDLNTSQLMTDFYRYVFQKNNYAHSLRLAKLNLINSEDTAFPKFWSGFELVGD
ncbi:MAG: CHAT domain-containing protein [Bacteroidales bacterium]|nr:CHAT domain-containing protein [Bacteroidales bacterium]